MLHAFQNKLKDISYLTVIKHYQEKGLRDTKEIFYNGFCRLLKPKYSLFLNAGIELQKECIKNLYLVLEYQFTLDSAIGITQTPPKFEFNQIDNQAQKYLIEIEKSLLIDRNNNFDLIEDDISLIMHRNTSENILKTSEIVYQA